MNGAHDLGGMEGFGPIQAEPESEEPVFHAEWEARLYGLNRALGLLGQWNIDMGRHARERQHPADYLKHSYYENWLAGIETLLLESGLITDGELTTGKESTPVAQEIKDRALRADQIGKVPLRVTDYLREIDEPAQVQDRGQGACHQPASNRPHQGATIRPRARRHGA